MSGEEWAFGNESKVHHILNAENVGIHLAFQDLVSLSEIRELCTWYLHVLHNMVYEEKHSVKRLMSCASSVNDSYALLLRVAIDSLMSVTCLSWSIPQVMDCVRICYFWISEILCLSMHLHIHSSISIKTFCSLFPMLFLLQGEVEITIVLSVMVIRGPECNLQASQVLSIQSLIFCHIAISPHVSALFYSSASLISQYWAIYESLSLPDFLTVSSGSHLPLQGVNQGTLIDKHFPPQEDFTAAVRLIYLFLPPIIRTEGCT